MIDAQNYLAIRPRDLVSVLIATLGIAPVMIWSGPGVGKTEIIQAARIAIFRAVAKARGVHIPDDADIQLVERRIGDYDILDFGGLPYNDNGLQRRAVPDIWPGAKEYLAFVRDGGPLTKVYAILFLDEFPQGAREKQTVCQRLFDEGRNGDYVLPGHPKSDPNCERGLVLIVLAGNRQADRANSYGIGSQTGTRLINIQLRADVDDWLAWAAGVGLDPTVMAFIRQEPEYLHTLDPKAVTGPTPRTWARLAAVTATALSPEIEMAIYSGIVGEEAARAYLAMLHAARSINIEEALSDPLNADIPQEVGYQFATASLLIRRTTSDNFANVVTYVERIGAGEFVSPEIAVFVVETIVRRSPVLAETITYRDFGLRWADIRS